MQQQPIKETQQTQTGQGQSASQKLSSPSKQKMNNFSSTIIPIIRTVKINEHCYSIYSTLHKIPLAVHQSLDKSIMEGQASRQGIKDFQQQKAEQIQDQKFYTDSRHYENAYKILSYDKGHMAPARNYSSSRDLILSTYTYANCIPQNSYFNRGSWKNLESYCRNLIRDDKCQKIEIISGPVFYSDKNYQNHENLFQNHQIVLRQYGIIVPPKCYKIIKAIHKNNFYVSAFVLKNQKIIDNDRKINSFSVPIEQLELMTGLRFDLGQHKSLQVLDKEGMNKTMGDLHLQAFTKLFKFGKELSDLNGARLQGLGYKVKIDINALPKQQKVKIGLKDAENIINQEKSSARRKINSFLSLHRDAKQVEALSEQLQKIILENIKQNIDPSKDELKDKRYYNLIVKKLYGNNYGYTYPFQEELKKIFVKIDLKQQKDSNQIENNNEQNENIQHSNSTSFQPKKKTKQAKTYTQKKVDQEKQEKTEVEKKKRTKKAKKINSPSGMENKKQSDEEDQGEKTQQSVTHT